MCFKSKNGPIPQKTGPRPFCRNPKVKFQESQGHQKGRRQQNPKVKSRKWKYAQTLMYYTTLVHCINWEK